MAVILLEARIFGTLLHLVVDKLLDIAADIWHGLAFRRSSGATAAAVAVRVNTSSRGLNGRSSWCCCWILSVGLF